MWPQTNQKQLQETPAGVPSYGEQCSATASIGAPIAAPASPMAIILNQSKLTNHSSSTIKNSPFQPALTISSHNWPVLIKQIINDELDY